MWQAYDFKWDKEKRKPENTRGAFTKAAGHNGNAFI